MELSQVRSYKNLYIVSLVFLTLALAVILYYSMNKTIEISNVAQDEVVSGADKVSDTDDDNINHLKFGNTEGNVDYLAIPLPEKFNAENIEIQNHYMDSELYIFLKDSDASFFKEAILKGNHSNITSGRYEETDDGCELVFAMDGIYEYKSVLENNELYISFLQPRELYEKIVVIDPAGGGSNDGVSANGVLEKNVSLAVAKELKKLLDESDVKAYYTRMDDVNPKEESRVRLANDTKADMYIRIEADSKADETVYGVTADYNSDYFIPGFGNVELADVMEYEVVSEIKGKALGLEKAPITSYALIHSSVPGTAIKVGCVTNKQEAILLGRDDYIAKIAQGIYNGIIRAYEENE